MTLKRSVWDRKIDYLLKDLNYLREVRTQSKEKVLKNFESKLAIRHALQEIAQVLIDLAFHLCAQNKLPEPAIYRDAFPILAENDLLPQEMAVILAKWAGLRNLLTHFYDDVDDARLFDIIQEDLGIFDEFLRVIAEFDARD